MSSQPTIKAAVATATEARPNTGLWSSVRANAWPVTVVALFMGMLAVRSIPGEPVSSLSSTPLKRRIVFHGVDCILDGQNIRSEAGPVLDEAIRILKSENGPVAIWVDNTEDEHADEINGTSSTQCAAAVLDHLAAAAISKEQLLGAAIHGSP
jgi:hypothetical protein